MRRPGSNSGTHIHELQPILDDDQTQFLERSLYDFRVGGGKRNAPATMPSHALGDHFNGQLQ
jgi:hypothetical protein